VPSANVGRGFDAAGAPDAATAGFEATDPAGAPLAAAEPATDVTELEAGAAALAAADDAGTEAGAAVPPQAAKVKVSTGTNKSARFTIVVRRTRVTVRDAAKP